MPDSAIAADNRVFIVHGDPAAARELGAQLSRFSYIVTGTASSGRDAMSMIEGARPNVVLLSIALEGAASAAEEIRARWPVPVVFLAAPGDEPLLRRAGVHGPFGYVLEPYAERELRMNLEMVLVREALRTQTHALEDRFFAVNIDLLCCLDFSGYFKRLNPAWERTLGFTRAELMSRPFIEFVHPDDRDRTLNQNKDVRGGGRALGFENRYLCKDGSYRWLLWNAAPDAGQRVIYSVARDITERKRAEDERENLVRELRTALTEVKTLREILPICSYCRKIRDDEDYWHSVESYISEHTNATFSHGICPACYEQVIATQVEPLKPK